MFETPLKLIHSSRENQREVCRPSKCSIQSYLIGDQAFTSEQLSRPRVSVALTGSKFGSVWTRSGGLNPFQVLTHQYPREGVLGKKRRESEIVGKRFVDRPPPLGSDQLHSVLVSFEFRPRSSEPARSETQTHGHEEKGEAYFRNGYSHRSYPFISRFCLWVPRAVARLPCGPSYCLSLPNHEITPQPPKPTRTILPARTTPHP